MKASEARELARKLTIVRSREEREAVTPLLCHPDVEAEMERIRALIRSTIQRDPNACATVRMFSPFTDLKEKALFKRLMDDGYGVTKYTDGIVVDWVGG